MKDIDPPPESGSTDARRVFWNKALKAVKSAQKKEGRSVTVSEHQGMGTFINVDDTSARRAAGGGGACYAAPQVTLAGIELNTACYPNGFCEPGCADAFKLSDIGLNDTFDPFFIGKLCDTCVYFFRPTVIHGDFYHCGDPCNSGGGCDGDPCEPSDFQIDVIVSRIGSTWYCQVVIIGVSPCPSGNCTDYPFVVMELFYDEQPYSGNPNDPVTFTNDIVAFTTDCTAILRSNVFFDTIAACCTEGCGNVNVLDAGKNGTIVFTPVP